MGIQTTATYSNVNGVDYITVSKVTTNQDTEMYSSDDIATQLAYHQSEYKRFLKYQNFITNQAGTSTDTVPVNNQ